MSGQTAMLEAHPDTMAERILPFPEEPAAEQEPAYDTIVGGPSVDLIAYYEGQRAVLGYFSKINKGENFRARFRGAAAGDEGDFAVQEKRFRPRYGRGMNKKFDESEEAKDRLDEVAKSKFASSLGYSAAGAAQIRPKIVADSMLDSDYDDFASKYYGLANKEAKNRYMGVLDRRIKRLKKAQETSGASEPLEYGISIDIEEPTLWSVQLDESRGIVEAMPGHIDPDEKMTFSSFAGEFGSVFGGGELEEGVDVELHVRAEDFTNIRPDALRSGLFIHKNDPRYSRVRKDDVDRTEQLAWAWGDLPLTPMNIKLIEKLKLTETGVVLPADEFITVAHNPGAMNAFIKARTRNFNADNKDSLDVDERTGRSAGHAMEGKIERIGELIPSLEGEIKLFRTIYQASLPGSETMYKAGEWDAMRRVAEVRLHTLIDTARLNLELDTEQVKSMHRALTSKLWHEGSGEELAANWRVYASLGAQYAYARLIKAMQSRERCWEELYVYQPYLERGEQAKAA